MKFAHALLLLPLLLAACGGGSDPTPDKENAAPAAAIEATVNKTEAQQQRAENIAEAQDEESGTPAASGQTGQSSPAAQRPTTADPSVGDPVAAPR
ncbi:MAG TPA: hypothetical protein VGD10_04965 [Allosphingosinicella sp.]|uniref:hypothetical protein n=1 Tax=Allosphingosinicella sp. TaxID=2823234 RepID=UPI002ED91B9F